MQSRPRLLQVDTYDFLDPARDRHAWPAGYAILSHTWQEDGDEVSFHEMITKDAHTLASREAFVKLKFTHDQAKRDGLRSFWVDTCCIDKTSSSELSEAINSMYQWYAMAEVCYAYMSDVDMTGERYWEQFRNSRWFTRAWTLQELLAPKKVVFYDKHWNRLGCLSEPAYAKIISEVTGISIDMLMHKAELEDFSIAQQRIWRLLYAQACSLGRALPGNVMVLVPESVAIPSIHSFHRSFSHVTHAGVTNTPRATRLANRPRLARTLTSLASIASQEHHTHL